MHWLLETCNQDYTISKVKLRVVVLLLFISACYFLFGKLPKWMERYDEYSLHYCGSLCIGLVIFWLYHKQQNHALFGLLVLSIGSEYWQPSFGRSFEHQEITINTLGLLTAYAIIHIIINYPTIPIPKHRECFGFTLPFMKKYLLTILLLVWAITLVGQSRAGDCTIHQDAEIATIIEKEIISLGNTTVLKDNDCKTVVDTIVRYTPIRILSKPAHGIWKWMDRDGDGQYEYCLIEIPAQYQTINEQIKIIRTRKVCETERLQELPKIVQREVPYVKHKARAVTAIDCN